MCLLENEQRHPRLQSEKKNCTAAKYIRGCFIQGVKTNLCQKTTTALQPSTSSALRTIDAPHPPPPLPPLTRHPILTPCCTRHSAQNVPAAFLSGGLPPLPTRAEGSAHQSVGVLACDALLNSEQQ